jgi:hypothetical protein
MEYQARACADHREAETHLSRFSSLWTQKDRNSDLRHWIDLLATHFAEVLPRGRKPNSALGHAQLSFLGVALRHSIRMCRPR